MTYSQVCPGIDWIHYSSVHRLEHDFVVAPNVDASVIKLAFKRANGLEVDAFGDLVVQTAAGELRQPRPVMYQERVVSQPARQCPFGRPWPSSTHIHGSKNR